MSNIRNGPATIRQSAAVQSEKARTMFSEETKQLEQVITRCLRAEWATAHAYKQRAKISVSSWVALPGMARPALIEVDRSVCNSTSDDFRLLPGRLRTNRMTGWHRRDRHRHIVMWRWWWISRRNQRPADCKGCRRGQ